MVYSGVWGAGDICSVRMCEGLAIYELIVGLARDICSIRVFGRQAAVATGAEGTGPRGGMTEEENSWYTLLVYAFLGMGRSEGVAGEGSTNLGEGRQGRGGGGLRREKGDPCIYIFICFLRAQAPQINLGRLETYRASGRLVISLLQGRIRVMSLKEKKKMPLSRDFYPLSDNLSRYDKGIMCPRTDITKSRDISCRTQA